MHPALIQRSKPYFDIIPHIFHLISLLCRRSVLRSAVLLCASEQDDFTTLCQLRKNTPINPKNTRIGKSVRNRYAYIIKNKHGRKTMKREYCLDIDGNIYTLKR